MGGVLLFFFSNLIFFSCSNASDSNNVSSDNLAFSSGGIHLAGKGTKTIRLTSDSVASARAISADESLKHILNKDGIPQALDIQIVYKNKEYSYKDFTGVEENPSEYAEYCNNTDHKTRGPLHKFTPYDFIWVTHPTNTEACSCDGYQWKKGDTVVIIRFGAWDGSEIKIENVIGDMDSVNVYYQIGVLDTIIGELKDPRFTTWTDAKGLFQTEGNYLNCQVEGGDKSSRNISKWGKHWTDTKEKDVYGLSISLTVQSVDGLSIRYTCDGKNKTELDNCAFLSSDKKEDGSYKLWWCASKKMLDCVPKSLRDGLSNWSDFYNDAP